MKKKSGVELSILKKYDAKEFCSKTVYFEPPIDRIVSAETKSIGIYDSNLKKVFTVRETHLSNSVKKWNVGSFFYSSSRTIIFRSIYHPYDEIKRISNSKDLYYGKLRFNEIERVGNYVVCYSRGYEGRNDDLLSYYYKTGYVKNVGVIARNTHKNSTTICPSKKHRNRFLICSSERKNAVKMFDCRKCRMVKSVCVSKEIFRSGKGLLIAISSFLNKKGVEIVVIGGRIRRIALYNLCHDKFLGIIKLGSKYEEMISASVIYGKYLIASGSLVKNGEGKVSIFDLETKGKFIRESPIAEMKVCIDFCMHSTIMENDESPIMKLAGSCGNSGLVLLSVEGLYIPEDFATMDLRERVDFLQNDSEIFSSEEEEIERMYIGLSVFGSEKFVILRALLFQ